MSEVGTRVTLSLDIGILIFKIVGWSSDSALSKHSASLNEQSIAWCVCIRYCSTTTMSSVSVESLLHKLFELLQNEYP